MSNSRILPAIPTSKPTSKPPSCRMTGKGFLYGALFAVYEVLGNCVKWYNYGNLTKGGNPRHPLYMPLTDEFQEFDVWVLTDKRYVMPEGGSVMPGRDKITEKQPVCSVRKDILLGS